MTIRSKISRAKRALNFIAIPLALGFICHATGSWVPLYVVVGICVIAAAASIYIGTRKFRGDINIYIIKQDGDDQFISEERFRQMAQNHRHDDEILH